ncbi:imelysin [Malaciobacter halophilus]|uniref:Imelysin n=1 Tax=Malaciobacter halophilus TaxID=197482 RepID=A0A2N1J3G8_9BACT|nr:imelysin family protein [Malaciobacter halophilus]AXH09103.1 peptidase, M75 family [Malaciobacter halophilus]PKI81100.1 imelysin [Malaciobacter halophilus]
MKRVVLILALFVSFAFSNTFTNIIQNVSLPNVNKALEDINSLEKSYSKKDFDKLVKSWKKVQALYLAGSINEDYIDTPRYIDIFHHGNEDITKQLNRAIKSSDDASVELFRNSTKSINAIEYMLYKDEKLSKREKELLDVMFKAIKSHLMDIKTVYSNYLKSKQRSEKWGNAVIINKLIDSTYKLKEWRVGDPAGYSRKYKDNPDNKRAEYYLSKNSFSAIKAILDAHNEVIGEKEYKNFATMALNSGAKKQVMQVRKALQESYEELSKLKTDDFSNAQGLFEALSKFHNAYYLSLIEELSVTAKILDADGD